MACKLREERVRRVVEPILAGAEEHAWSDEDIGYVVECKLLHRDLESTIQRGLMQTGGYMDRCAAESGHLIVFDRSRERTWDEKSFRRPPPREGPPITVWGM